MPHCHTRETRNQHTGPCFPCTLSTFSSIFRKFPLFLRPLCYVKHWRCRYLGFAGVTTATLLNYHTVNAVRQCGRSVRVPHLKLGEVVNEQTVFNPLFLVAEREQNLLWHKRKLLKQQQNQQYRAARVYLISLSLRQVIKHLQPAPYSSTISNSPLAFSGLMPGEHIVMDTSHKH